LLNLQYDIALIPFSHSSVYFNFICAAATAAAADKQANIDIATKDGLEINQYSSTGLEGVFPSKKLPGKFYAFVVDEKACLVGGEHGTALDTARARAKAKQGRGNPGEAPTGGNTVIISVLCIQEEKAVAVDLASLKLNTTANSSSLFVGVNRAEARWQTCAGSDYLGCYPDEIVAILLD